SKLDISKLPDDNKSAILPLWNWLARTKIKTSVSEQAFGNNYKLLVSNVENEYKLKIVEHLCKQIQSFEEFSSEKYYNSLNELEAFIEEKALGINVTDYLIEINKEPEIFVEYVLYATDKYTDYKITTPSKKLQEYLSKCISEKPSELEVLKYLTKDKSYQFDEVKNKIEETIQNLNCLMKIVLNTYLKHTNNYPMIYH